MYTRDSQLMSIDEEKNDTSHICALTQRELFLSEVNNKDNNIDLNNDMYYLQNE